MGEERLLQLNHVSVHVEGILPPLFSEVVVIVTRQSWVPLCLHFFSSLVIDECHLHLKSDFVSGEAMCPTLFCRYPLFSAIVSHGTKNSEVG